MEAKLFVTSGKTDKGSVKLKLPTTLGRSREAGVTVAHPMISRQHCELTESGGLLWIRDLGSLNGTVMGGQKIRESPLRPSDEFTIGPLTFRVEYEFAGDLDAVPGPTLAEEQPPATIAPSEPLEVPGFAAVDETPQTPEAEEPIAEAEPAADEDEDVDPFNAVVMEATEVELEEPSPAAAGTGAQPGVDIETESEEPPDEQSDEGPVVVFDAEPEDKGGASPAGASPAHPHGEPAVQVHPEPADPREAPEGAAGLADIEAMREAPDFSFMDDEEPAPSIDEGAPPAEEDEFVSVELVEEEEPEPTPPPGLGPAKKPAPPIPGKKPAPPAAGRPTASQPPGAPPDFAALADAESDEEESTGAEDAALEDFFKGLP